MHPGAIPRHRNDLLKTKESRHKFLGGRKKFDLEEKSRAARRAGDKIAPAALKAGSERRKIKRTAGNARIASSGIRFVRCGSIRSISMRHFLSKVCRKTVVGKMFDRPGKNMPSAAKDFFTECRLWLRHHNAAALANGIEPG